MISDGLDPLPNPMARNPQDISALLAILEDIFSPKHILFLLCVYLGRRVLEECSEAVILSFVDTVSSNHLYFHFIIAYELVIAANECSKLQHISNSAVANYPPNECQLREDAFNRSTRSLRNDDKWSRLRLRW